MLQAALAILPSLVLWLVALVVAGVRWQRHPLVSTLVVTSGALHIIGSLAQVVLPVSMMQGDSDSEVVGGLTRFTLMMVGSSLSHFVASVCMVVAVFVGRGDAVDRHA